MSEEASAHCELDILVGLCHFSPSFFNSFFLFVFKQLSLEPVWCSCHQGLTERRNAEIDKLYSRT